MLVFTTVIKIIQIIFNIEIGEIGKGEQKIDLNDQKTKQLGTSGKKPLKEYFRSFK